MSTEVRPNFRHHANQSLRLARRLLVLCLVFAAVASRAEEPVGFLILSDTRDKQGFDKGFELARKSVGNDMSFILAPGDMTPLPKTRGVIDKVFGPKMVWYPVIGNHETAEKSSMQYLSELYRKQLKGKVNPGPIGTEETTYSFDAGDVHIVAINEYWNGQASPGSDIKADGDVVPALREWLKTDLARSQMRWKLVVGHEPAYPQVDRDWGGTRHAGDSLDRHKVNRDAFWKVLEEQGATAYLCGHTHRYSRFKPQGGKVWQIDAAQIRQDDTWKYDAFILVTADAKSLKFQTYRNLKERGRFEVTDNLSFPAKDIKH